MLSPTTAAQCATEIVDDLAATHPEMTGAVRAQAIADWTKIINRLYIRMKADTVVVPGTMQNPSGQSVTVSPATGVGATSAPQTIVGAGLLT